MPSISNDSFRQAESNLDFLKVLLAIPELQQIFVESPNFLSKNSNGEQIQKCNSFILKLLETYLGRYLSFTALHREAPWVRKQYFHGLVRQQRSAMMKVKDNVGDMFHTLHKNLHAIIT